MVCLLDMVRSLAITGYQTIAKHGYTSSVTVKKNNIYSNSDSPSLKINAQDMRFASQSQALKLKPSKQLHNTRTRALLGG